MKRRAPPDIHHSSFIIHHSVVMARKLQADEWLFACVVALALFGVIMVYSASAIVAATENHSQYFYVVRQSVFTGIGLFAMLAGMRFDYGRLRDPKIVYGLLALSFVLLVGVFAFRSEERRVGKESRS